MSGWNPLLNDTFTEEGARALGEIISAYWGKRGHVVTYRVVSKEFHKAVRHVRYEIETNLVDGLPSKKSLDKSANKRMLAA